LRVLREAFLSILATSLLLYGVVNAGITAKTIYDIEMDINYAAAARQQLVKQYTRVEEKRDAALRENDIVAASEYEMLLDAITLIDRRVNIIAIGEQVQQTKEAFLEDQWAKFVAERVIGAMGWGFSRIGFGEVTDTYIKGRNWPPRSNFVTYNPVTDQNVRIILGGRPELTIIKFSDEISDFGKMTLEIFDQIRSKQANKCELMTAYDAQKFISEQLEKLEGIRALPSDIGTYIASSMIRKGEKAGSHISDQEELSEFARDWACKRLTELATAQSTVSPAGLERSEALWSAVDMICGALPGSVAKEPQGQTDVIVKEKSEESAKEEGTGAYDGLYRGELKTEDNAGTRILNSSVVLEVAGDKVTVTIEHTVYFEAIINGDCFATLTQLYKGEGTLNNPVSIDLVCKSYNLSTEGGGCGSYKERYDADNPVGRTAKFIGNFVDSSHFEGSFLNLKLSLAK